MTVYQFTLGGTPVLWRHLSVLHSGVKAASAKIACLIDIVYQIHFDAFVFYNIGLLLLPQCAP